MALFKIEDKSGKEFIEAAEGKMQHVRHEGPRDL